jgi:hypothetical protein
MPVQPEHLPALHAPHEIRFGNGHGFFLPVRYFPEIIPSLPGRNNQGKPQSVYCASIS